MSYKDRIASQTLTNNTDAEFRSWVSYISAGLEAGGVIKTADIGQINTATVAKPSSSATVAGYEIRRFSDTLQATKPVFIKIEYGSGNAQTAPSIWVTVGTGSNGSGTITGILFARSQSSLAEVSTATASRMVSVNTDRLVFSLHYLNFAQMMFALERTKNADGTNSGDGLLLGLNNSIASSKFAVLNFTGSQPTVEVSSGCLIPSADPTTFGSNVGIFPPLLFNFGANVNPGLNFYGYRSTEIATDTVITAEVYGANHDYLPTGSNMNVFFIATRNNNAVLLRYE